MRSENQLHMVRIPLQLRPQDVTLLEELAKQESKSLEEYCTALIERAAMWLQRRQRTKDGDGEKTGERI
jgi:hypothetical protein